MADTFVKIATVTVGSGGTSSIDFSSIPSTYTDLCIKASVRSNIAGIVDAMLISFNGSTSSITNRYLYGSGSAASSGTTPARYAGESVGSTATSNTFSNMEIYFPNYTLSNNKSFSVDLVTENNATAADSALIAGLWSVTSAINQITLSPNAATLFSQYTTATLYGIKNS